MNLGAMHRKKRSFSVLAKCGGCKRWTVELRRAVEEMRVLVWTVDKWGRSVPH
jgi:hypothetical protein